MKRITRIEIENFRAFYGKYGIELAKGENLLVYGENGSGKSSLFKALNNYLSSSRNSATSFVPNHHNLAANGEIKITFSDADPSTQILTPGTDQTLDFGRNASTNSVQFVKDGDLIKGFLDYRNLLDVYNHKVPIPNLFKLIVTELLLEHFPIGGTESLGRKYLRLKDELYFVHNRRTKKHKNALDELVTFQSELDDALKRIFIKMNYLLITYFKSSLIVNYALLPIEYVYMPDWHIQSDLRLDITLNGVSISDHQDILNEARLSALATCIYLASILVNPKLGFDLKILYLDDIFIGLDTGNRLPIIKILISEFNQHQIFVSTYDRQWFELAQRFFKSHAPDKWKSAELYTSTETLGATIFEIPVLLPFEDNFDKAVFYLHHKTKPDYPAAANFFRKSVEEILTSCLPDHEIRNDDSVQIEPHKLGKLIKVGLKFFDRIGANKSLLLQLQNALPTLLHPLSHYNLASQTYKSELEEVQKLILTVKIKLQELQNSCREFIPKGRMFKLNFAISATEIGHYEIHTKETIYVLRNPGGHISVSTGICHCKTCYTMIGGVQSNRQNFNNNDAAKQYTSIENSYETIYNHIHSIAAYSHIAKAANCLTEFEYNDGLNLNTIENHKASVVW